MKTKYFVIIGCGRLGSTLANRLSAIGHSIVMIDRNNEAFEMLDTGFSGFKVFGDANEFFILKQAKAEKADVVLAVTSDDNLNIMLAQLCQTIFGVQRVIARISKPGRQKIY
ncbi:MAG: TrkA family potassium uptake protein, partial [Candidatus Cloacimonadaceae bacterium]|nr:TrkA family potassium uptake protein [Candidatus Cloacimonadaceae bacterium]